MFSLRLSSQVRIQVSQEYSKTGRTSERKTASQPVCQKNGQPARQRDSQLVNEPSSQPPSQPASRTDNQLDDQSVRQPNRHTASQTTRLPALWPRSLRVRKSPVQTQQWCLNSEPDIVIYVVTLVENKAYRDLFLRTSKIRIKRVQIGSDRFTWV